MWDYQHEESLICPHCDRAQTLLEEDLYGIGDCNPQRHTCEHCGEGFWWQIRTLVFDSKAQ